MSRTIDINAIKHKRLQELARQLESGKTLTAKTFSQLVARWELSEAELERAMRATAALQLALVAIDDLDTLFSEMKDQ